MCDSYVLSLLSQSHVIYACGNGVNTMAVAQPEIVHCYLPRLNVARCLQSVTAGSYRLADSHIIDPVSVLLDLVQITSV